MIRLSIFRQSLFATITASLLASTLPALAQTPAPAFAPVGAPLAPPASPPAPPGRAAASQPRRDLSNFPKVKVFPDNVLIDADIALAGRTGAGTSVGLTYSFRRLPALGSFTPRIADER